MKVLFATLLLVAGCATQPAIETAEDTLDEPEETLVREETIMVSAESLSECPRGSVAVCKMHYVSKEDCRCVRRGEFNGAPALIR